MPAGAVTKEYELGSHYVHAEPQHQAAVVADIVAFFDVAEL